MKTRIRTTVHKAGGSLVIYATKACTPLNIRPGEPIYVTIERAKDILKDTDADAEVDVEIFR